MSWSDLIGPGRKVHELGITNYKSAKEAEVVGCAVER